MGSQGGKVAGELQGDIMTSEKRSALMSRIKGKDTGPEKAIMGELLLRGLDFEALNLFKAIYTDLF